MPVLSWSGGELSGQPTRMRGGDKDTYDSNGMLEKGYENKGKEN